MTARRKSEPVCPRSWLIPAYCWHCRGHMKRNPKDEAE